MLHTELELQKIFYKNKKINKYKNQVSKISKEQIFLILQNYASTNHLSLVFST